MVWLGWAIVNIIVPLLKSAKLESVAHLISCNIGRCFRLLWQYNSHKNSHCFYNLDERPYLSKPRSSPPGDGFEQMPVKSKKGVGFCTPKLSQTKILPACCTINKSAVFAMSDVYNLL
jgi:hypothetical protein